MATLLGKVDREVRHLRHHQHRQGAGAHLVEQHVTPALRGLTGDELRIEEFGGRPELVDELTDHQHLLSEREVAMHEQLHDGELLRGRGQGPWRCCDCWS